MAENEEQKKKKKEHHSFKTPSRFRLSFINENRFNTIWTIRFSRLKVVIAVCIILLAITSMVSMLILLTPVRTLLPGYLKESQRQQLIENSMRVDSLLMRTSLNTSYLNNLQRVFKSPGDTVSIRQPSRTDTVMEVDSLLPASDLEKEFVRRYDEQEKFNIKVLSAIAADGIYFFPPAAGTYEIKHGDSNALSSAIICAPATPITAVLPGTVVDCHPTGNGTYTALIQHANGFLSKYSGLGNLLVDRGAKVDGGGAIGHCRNGEAALPVTIELWHDGTKLNPADYLPPAM